MNLDVGDSVQVVAAGVVRSRPTLRLVSCGSAVNPCDGPLMRSGCRGMQQLAGPVLCDLLDWIRHSSRCTPCCSTPPAVSCAARDSQRSVAPAIHCLEVNASQALAVLRLLSGLCDRPTPSGRTLASDKS